MTERPESKVVRRGARGKSVPFPFPFPKEPNKEVKIIAQSPEKVAPNNQNKPSAEDLEQIYTVFKDLDKAVEELGPKIRDIANKQSGDFINAYRLEIIAKKKDLQDQKRLYDEMIAMVNRDAKVVSLEKELTYYKEKFTEAEKTIKETNDKMKVLKQHISALQEENFLLARCIKDKIKKVTKSDHQLLESQNRTRTKFKSLRYNTHQETNPKNRHVVDVSPLREKSETFKTLQASPSFESEGDLLAIGLGEGFERFLGNLQEMIINDKPQAIKEVEAFCVALAASYQKKIEDLKKKARSEKLKFNEFLFRSKNSETNELAEFFNCCVNSVRKNIIKRKQMMLSTFTKFSNKTTGWPNFTETPFSIMAEDFTLNDKQKVLEIFVSHPLVVQNMRETIFSNKEKFDFSKVRDESPPKLRKVSFKNEDHPSKQISLNTNDESCLTEVSSYVDTKESTKHPTTGGNISDSRDLPKILETESIDPLYPKDSRNIHIKFAQLIGAKDTLEYRPKGRTMMKQINQSYNI